MAVLMDYAILQRDGDGFARTAIEGEMEKTLGEKEPVCVRIVREDDNLVIAGWRKCEVEGLHWRADLTIPEGGPYRIEVCQVRDGSSAKWSPRIRILYHVGVGDIYLTAGQSNMSGYGRDTAFDPPQLGVHAFRNTGRWDVAAHPLCSSIGSLYGDADDCSESSPALSFARTLSNRLHVPIGLVPAAIGGTPLSRWSPAETGDAWKMVLERLKTVGKIKGIIWFQGCSDATPNASKSYYDRFRRAVEGWRETLGDIFILTAQINRWVGDPELFGKPELTEVRTWGFIRDAQRRAALTIPGVSCVPTYDLPTCDGIHLSSTSNVTLGERFASAALSEIYGRPEKSPVAITSAEYVDESHLRIILTEGHPMDLMDGTADGMEVEDETGLIPCVRAKVDAGGFLIETERPYRLPAEFHFSWRIHPAMFMPREQNGMPLLACYGLPIEASV